MGVAYQEIIERMRFAGKLKNDSAVARILGITPQALSNYKKKGELPSGLVVKFANLTGLSIDWLLTGDGFINKDGSQSVSFEKIKGVKIADLSREEWLYIGKLLKILRGENERSLCAIRYIVDSLSNSCALLDEVNEVKKAG